METTKGLYGVIQKNAPKFQVVVTTGPPQCTKLGPSLRTLLVSRQSAHFLNRIFYFTVTNSFSGGGGRVKEDVER